LLYVAQAAAAAPDAARAAAAELIGHDYQALERTFRLEAVPVGFQADWRHGVVTVIDAAHRARRLSLDTAARGGGEAPPLTLTALQHVPLLRELSVDTSGRTRDFTVLLELEHPAAAELTVTLTAPSGVQA